MSKSLTMQSFRAFLRSESGATAIEYALLASGIAVAIIAAVLATGTSLQTKYQTVSDSLH